MFDPATDILRRFDELVSLRNPGPSSTSNPGTDAIVACVALAGTAAFALLLTAMAMSMVMTALSLSPDRPQA